MSLSADAIGAMGSSREQAVTALIAAGVFATIAASFARIYFRNAINNGLLVIECPQIVPHLQTGDTVDIDIANVTVHCAAGAFEFPRLPRSVKGIVQAGGLIPYLQQTHDPPPSS